jgi:glycosyltransferase involved in cell wall biosynthesis
MYGCIAKILSGGRLKLVITQHSFIHLDQRFRYRIYERIFARLTDEITAVSSDILATYRRLGICRRRISVITNGIDFPAHPEVPISNRFHERREIARSCASTVLHHRADDHWLLYLARIFPRKGQEHALELWNNLDPAVRAKSVLVFVGPESQEGARATLEYAIGRSEDCNRIVLAGPTNSPGDWLRVSDLYLSCSEYEGMPLGPLEAVCAGLPTLLSDIPGHEFLRDHSWQFNLEEPKQGAHRLEEVLSAIADGGRLLRRECTRRAEDLRQQFSLNRMAEDYRSIYEQAIGGVMDLNPVIEHVGEHDSSHRLFAAR